MEKQKNVAIGRIYEPTGEVLNNGFTAKWQDWCFCDLEIEHLLKGEETPVITRKGNIVVGELAKLKNEEGEYWAFSPCIQHFIADYELSDEERKALKDGKELYIDKFWNPKTCKYYSSHVTWDGENIVIHDK